MFTKKFLAPVLALAAIGLPARASTATYCDIGCPNSNSAFAVATNSLSFANGGVFLIFADSSPTALYTDSLTGTGFADLTINEVFTISGGTLATSVSDDIVQIVVPNGYTALEFYITLSLGVTLGLDSENSLVNPGAHISTLVGFTNDSLTGWTVDISPYHNSSGMTITGFDVGGPASSSETPEVGTLLLIGAGLIAMRWLPRRAFRTPRLA